MSNPIVSQSETKHNTPDAAACVDREQRRRKLEQEIDMLYGQITPAITANDPTAWKGTVTAFFEDAVKRADAGQEAK